MTGDQQQTSGIWPKQSKLKNTALTFSGVFSAKRVNSERSRSLVRLAEKILLVIVIALGAAGLGLNAQQAWHHKNWVFFLDRSAYNLAFWIGAYLAAYLWAQTKQQRLDQQKMNLLHWEDDTENPAPSELDVYSFFNSAAKACWNKAYFFAQLRRLSDKQKKVEVSATDLMLALLEDRDVQTLFYRLSVDPRDIQTFLKNYSRLADGATEGELQDIPFTAFLESLKLHNKAVDPLMLVCALKIELPEKHIIQGIFFNINTTNDDLEVVCSWIFNLQLLQDEVKLLRQLSRYKPTSGSNRGLTAVPSPYLDHYSKDLTFAAKMGALPLALGRGRDLQEMFKLLSSGKKNILIKGEAGTGRTTLINELAYKMTTEQVPGSLSDMRLIQLEISGILGNPQRSEQALVKALQEATKSDNIVLVISGIQELARAQTQSGISLLEILLNFLQTYSLTVFATSTNEDYTNFLRNAPNFDQIFSSYELKTLTLQEILLACCIKASLLEFKNKCLFRYPVIKQAVELTDLYMKGANQPQKTVALLVEAASRTKSQKNRLVTIDTIQTIVSDKTHIPSATLSRDESYKLLHLEEDLSKYVIGQSAALTAVAEGLRRARSGLSSETRPLASFLFLGPTGVGKTEVAKTLAKVYFGEEKFLLRLDMSEYQSEGGLEKLIGSQASKTDTPLVNHLKNYPFCLLLLDEFEKASPQVLNLFLQILEDGRVTSGKGELVDLTHTLIIATSNAGSGDIQTGIKAGQNIDHIKALLLDQILLKYYPPELMNRFDGVIIFSPLSPDEVASIVHLQLESLKQQLRGKGIKVNFSAAVAQDIATKAYDPAFGARPIRRYLQDHVETFIAKLLLQKTLERGTELTIDIQDGKLVIT